MLGVQGFWIFRSTLRQRSSWRGCGTERQREIRNLRLFGWLETKPHCRLFHSIEAHTHRLHSSSFLWLIFRILPNSLFLTRRPHAYAEALYECLSSKHLSNLYIYSRFNIFRRKQEARGNLNPFKQKPYQPPKAPHTPT